MLMISRGLLSNTGEKSLFPVIGLLSLNTTKFHTRISLIFRMNCRDIGTHPVKFRPDYKLQILKGRGTFAFLLQWENMMSNTNLGRKIFILNSSFHILVHPE